jgi:hypothetical protein
MRLPVLAAAIAIFLIGCEKPYDTSATDNLQNYIQKITKKRELKGKVYLVSPIEGCSPCINKTIRFIKENLDKKEISFVVSHDTEKPIRFKFSQEELSNKNVLIDSRGVAVSSGVIWSNPSVYYIKEGKVVEYKHLQPSDVDSAFIKIQSWIQN